MFFCLFVGFCLLVVFFFWLDVIFLILDLIFRMLLNALFFTCIPGINQTFNLQECTGLVLSVVLGIFHCGLIPCSPPSLISAKRKWPQSVILCYHLPVCLHPGSTIKKHQRNIGKSGGTLLPEDALGSLSTDYQPVFISCMPIPSEPRTPLTSDPIFAQQPLILGSANNVFIVPWPL